MPELASTSLNSDGNLVAYYKLEDTSDSKGSRTLTNNNSATFPAGKFNNGGQTVAATPSFFNRSADDYGIAGNGNLSISFWVKITAAPSSGNTMGLGIFRSQLTSDRYFSYAYKNNGGTLQLIIDNSGTTATYNVDLGTSTFHNIVVTRTGTTSCKLWLDGVDTGITAAQGGSTAGTSDFGISTNGAVASDAIFDDVAIFSRVLNGTDVTTIYYDPIAYTKNFTETITLSDILVRAFTRVFTDVSVITDIIVKGRFISLTESVISLSDSLLGRKRRGSLFTETPPTNGDDWTRI